MSEATKMVNEANLSVSHNKHDAEQAHKAFKNQHALHVLLIMETLGLTKAQADVVAWAEGRLGYSKRMAEK